MTNTLKKIGIGSMAVISLLFCAAKCNTTPPANDVVTTPPPIPEGMLVDTITLIYQLAGSTLKADTSALVIMDTANIAPLQFRLSTGEILPDKTFVWIYSFKHEEPLFPITD